MNREDLTLDGLMAACAPGYPKGPYEIPGGARLAPEDWSDALFRAARIRGLRINARCGLEARRGGTFFGARVPAIEVTCSRDPTLLHAYLLLGEERGNTRVMLYRLDEGPAGNAVGCDAGCAVGDEELEAFIREACGLAKRLAASA